MVGINATEANSLASLCSICHPSIIDKASITAMIMLHLAPMLPTVCFKCMLCFNYFCWCPCFLEKHKLQLQKMIHKYLHKSSFELGYKAWLCWHHLVNWNTLTRGNNVCNRPNVLHVCMGMPRSFMHSSKMHAEHFGTLACVNLLGNIPILANVCRTPKLRWLSL